MITNLANLRAEADATRRAWEELDPAHTSFEMRKKAETRYLSLRALLRRMEPVQAQAAPRVTSPEKWRAAADKAARC